MQEDAILANPPGKRRKLLSCRVFYRPVTALSASLPYALDMDFTGRFLHENPEFLGRVLQKKIFEVSSRYYEAVLMGYGMCGNSVAGLTAGEVPLVIPRVHDCVSMFLGSHSRYLEEFSRDPGTFWYIPEYLEAGDPGTGYRRHFGHPLGDSDEDAPGSSGGVPGDDRTGYLREVMGAWKRRYRRAVLLESDDRPREELWKRIKRECLRNRWEFVRMPGSPRLFEKLLKGPWDEEFLVLQPGETVPSFLAPGN